MVEESMWKALVAELEIVILVGNFLTEKLICLGDDTSNLLISIQ
jgi:hypothetical protein